jgi:hypothetical protein
VRLEAQLRLELGLALPLALGLRLVSPQGLALPPELVPGLESTLQPELRL